MKTTLIQIDENDDILSIKDKMQWNPSKRILLIVPHNNKSIHRRIDLVLLQRAAKKQGAQLAISTSQKYLQGLGKLTGVKVFSTVLAAQKQDWPDFLTKIWKPESQTRIAIGKFKEYNVERKKERLLPIWQKILFFTLGTLAPIVLVLILIPQGRITLYPKQTPQRLILEFSTSPAYTIASLEGKIPASPQKVILSETDAIPTTGETSIPDHFATGTVRITNLSENELFLPAHLRLNSDNPNLQFQTLTGVFIPAGKGLFVDVPISALTAGIVGNLPPLSINSVSEPYGSLLQVTNLISTTGGSDIRVKAVSESDVQLLKSQVSQKLRADVLSQIENSSPTEKLTVTESLQLVRETMTTNLEIDDPGDQLTIEVTGTYQFLTIKQDDLDQFVSTLAAVSIPQGYQQVAGTLHYSDPVITSFEAGEQIIHAQIEITQSIQKAVDNNEVVSTILGKTKKQAMNIIESYIDMKQTPMIVLFPSFWFWIPLIPDQIVIDYPGVQ